MDMSLFLKILGAALSIALGAALKFLFNRIDKFIDAVDCNTKELAVLNSKIESISKNQERIPELESDIKKLGQAHRRLADRLNGAANED